MRHRQHSLSQINYAVIDMSCSIGRIINRISLLVMELNSSRLGHLCRNLSRCQQRLDLSQIHLLCYTNFSLSIGPASRHFDRNYSSRIGIGLIGTDLISIGLISISPTTHTTDSDLEHKHHHLLS